MVSWDEKAFDILANDLHRKQIADQHTAEEIADSASRSVGAVTLVEFSLAYDAALVAVRMARGEGEIL